jgi:hypothetical protein
MSSPKKNEAATPGQKTLKFTSPFDMFATDKAKEADGIVLNYSDVFWIKIGRAGGSNDRYKSIMTEKLRPYRRAIQTDTIDEAASTRVMREAVAEGIVQEWGTGVYPNGKGFIPGPRGQEPIGFSVDNIVKVFEQLPDLFTDVYEQANKVSLFRSTEIEADAGN